MYIFHLCVKAKVSFKEIKMVAKYYGLHPDVRASSEISNEEFLQLMKNREEPEFQSFYQDYCLEVNKKAKAEKQIFILQEQERLADLYKDKKEGRAAKSEYIDNNGDLEYYDEEDEIMKALEQGNGDRFGF